MPETLKAGEQAPADGIYRVTHYQHRLPHSVSVLKGTVLPRCLKCGDRVRYEFVKADNVQKALGADADFSGNP